MTFFVIVKYVFCIMLSFCIEILILEKSGLSVFVTYTNDNIFFYSLIFAIYI